MALCFFSFGTAGAQDTGGNDGRDGAALAGYRRRVYAAFVTSSMADWKIVMDEMERTKTADVPFLLDVLNYQYGYIGWCIGEERRDEAERSLSLAEENLRLLRNLPAPSATLSAYEAALVGFRIGLSPVSAPFIGPRGMEAARKALEYDGNNPFAHIQHGNVLYYMPPLFGGSRTEALAHYKTAAGLMERRPGGAAGDWNYLSLLVTIARAYEDLGDLASARDVYVTILDIEPAFAWVKNDLLPALQRRMR